ncbi:MAG TPA: asparagine synthase C-terminal domain-containing protein, partial [Chitinophagaceae bacterium]|nr:asparagine synthase C-terminal domain-containing protein [Chitinophagaceae bacterium]
ALSGDGGDELFAGYGIYKRFKKIYSYPFNFKSPYYNKLIWGNVHKLIPPSVKGKGLTYYLSLNKEYSFAYLNTWTPGERKKLMLNGLSPVNYEKASELYKAGILKNKSTNDFMTRMQYLDMRTYMVDDILTKVDRASMMNSLEVRVPLLDHKFAELTFKIPSGLKFKKENQKYIFKQTMAPFLPKNILEHPKQGFAVPISLWFKDDLKEYVNDIFYSGDCSLYNYLDRKYVQQKIIGKQIGTRDFSGRIWMLLFFNEWLKQNQ